VQCANKSWTELFQHTRGALQIQDRSPQSRNWRTVALCNSMFSRQRSATARPVFFRSVVWFDPVKWEQSTSMHSPCK